MNPRSGWPASQEFVRCPFAKFNPGSKTLSSDLDGPLQLYPREHEEQLLTCSSEIRIPAPEAHRSGKQHDSQVIVDPSQRTLTPDSSVRLARHPRVLFPKIAKIVGQGINSGLASYALWAEEHSDSIISPQEVSNISEFKDQAQVPSSKDDLNGRRVA